MQHIATAKSEIAALLTKVNDYSGNSNNQQLEFRSFMQQADKVYGQPDEPNKAPVNRAAVNPNDNTQKNLAAENRQTNQQSQKKTLQENRKDDPREYAHPVEQKSSNQRSETETDDNAHTVEASDQKRDASSKSSAQHKPQIDNATEKSEITNADGTNADSQAEGELHTPADQALAKNANGNNTEQQSSDASGNNNGKIMLDESVPEEALVDEAALIDWLALVENSIAKANEGSDTKTDAKDKTGEFSIAEIVLANNNETELTELPTLQQRLLLDVDGGNSEVDGGNSEVESNGENIKLDILKAANQDPLLAQVEGVENEAEINVDDLDQEASSTLASLNALITELQTVYQAQQQGSDAEQAESIDQLLTHISQFVDEINPQVMDKLRATLAIEPEAISALQSNGIQAVEADNSALEDLQLILDLLAEGQAKPIVIQHPEIQSTKQQTPEMVLSEHEKSNTTAQQLDKSLVALLDMPEENLDAALANLAQRLDLKATNGQLNNGSDASIKSEFVNALKAGVEELKAQIKQGHQPAIDLSSLVTEAASKVNLIPIVPEVLDQSVTRFNQTLELTSQLNAKVEQLQQAFVSEKSLIRENNNQAQHLQHKQGQQVAQFDKAVNITRHEGLQQLTEKVRWMANQNNMQAEIRLDPPDLGAMKIRLNMSGDTASVNIVVQSQQTRDVLEQATPRLKELLEQQGIELGQSSVQQEQNDGAQQQQNSEYVGPNGSQDNIQEEAENVIEQRISHGRLGGIDYFV